ncbi:hypothetical protein [Ralstonia pseudosolanacearum]|uniref:hypothetical protein n=1 Tax=Ralstonia pseudosolanacearum TaxID=1310165 RepID=UPI001E64703C|nr:hypothetical protein [Ralstonia pseudosolanacearum]
MTCYTLAVESEAPATPVSQNVCGLPSTNHYRSKFLTDVKMQGSGQALDGNIVHYSGQGCFNIDSCPRTATSACATVGTTIAVDRRCCINQGRGEAVLTFTRNNMAVTL